MDPADPGGATNHGISSRWAKRAGLDIDVSKLTQVDAKGLYFQFFWRPYRFAEWKEDAIAAKVFDATVNMGPAEAMRCFQRALRSCGQSSVLDDGVCGPVTERAKDRAVAAVGVSGLLVAYRSELAGFYRRLAERRPESAKFLNGWLRRAYDEI